MAYEIGICDDEAYQVKVNALMLQEIASKNKMNLKLHGFQTGSEVEAYLKQRRLDILFLDIDLGEENGIELAMQLMAQHPETVVIFVTGHREFAGEAFEVEAMGYLVKPFDIRKMESILKKAMIQVSGLQRQQISRELVITHENIKKKLPIREILSVQREISKSVIHTAKKDYVVYETITALHERLGNGFMRVNQSDIVSRQQIAEIKKNTVYLKNGTTMTIGRTYRRKVMEQYFGAEKGNG